MMANVLPKALKNGTDMVADGEFVIELTSGSSMFYVWRKRGEKKNTLKSNTQYSAQIIFSSDQK